MANDKKTIQPITIFIIMIAIVIGIWTISFFALKDCENRGTFGDMFGGVNALFAGLAFAGLIYTILLQKDELKLQRDELSETRVEFKTQNETLKAQRFENTFFNMLDLHHRIVDGIDQSKSKKERTNSGLSFSDRQYQYVTETLKGRDVFRSEYISLKTRLESNNVSGSPVSFDELYLVKYDDVQIDFGHYFRNVYRIIKLIDNTDFYPLHMELDERKKLNFSERYKYTSILRAQLSDYEILWLFYNCLSSNGITKFKPLIEKYSMFKNLPIDKLHDENLVKQYDAIAFQPASSEDSHTLC